MNGAIRKALRAAVKAAMDPVFTIGAVYSGRIYDARDDKPFLLVYFADGQREINGLSSVTGANLVLGLHLPYVNYCDDDLDDWADKLAAVIDGDNDLSLDDSISGIIYDGFEYGEPDESPYINLNLQYTVIS